MNVQLAGRGASPSFRAEVTFDMASKDVAAP
jgi:hypothetical protein